MAFERVFQVWASCDPREQRESVIEVALSRRVRSEDDRQRREIYLNVAKRLVVLNACSGDHDRTISSTLRIGQCADFSADLPGVAGVKQRL